MTSEAKPRIKVTYATLRADNEELHSAFEEAADDARSKLGGYHRNYVDGAWRDGVGTFEARSPIDSEILLGTFASGTPADIDEAIAAARRAQPAWAATPWRERLAILRRAAELISDRLLVRPKFFPPMPEALQPSPWKLGLLAMLWYRHRRAHKAFQR